MSVGYARGVDVLHEDNHVLVVSKPAGLATMGVRAEEPSLVRVAKDYLKQRYDKPGNVYLGIVSRLDAVTSGALVLARTTKAAKRLSEAFQTGAVRKTYWVVVPTTPNPATGACRDYLKKDEPRQRMAIARPEAPDAREARLRYRTIETLGEYGALVEVDLETGRKHQIRVQFAHRGWPVRGDRKYGSKVPFPEGIALHSRRITFEHPVKKTTLEIEAPLPESWRAVGLESR